MIKSKSKSFPAGVVAMRGFQKEALNGNRQKAVRKKSSNQTSANNGAGVPGHTRQRRPKFAASPACRCTVMQTNLRSLVAGSSRRIAKCVQDCSPNRNEHVFVHGSSHSIDASLVASPPLGYPTYQWSRMVAGPCLSEKESFRQQTAMSGGKDDRCQSIEEVPSASPVTVRAVRLRTADLQVAQG
jgi:hypothetical protein